MTSPGAFRNPQGRSLAYRLWQPPSCNALVVIVHGFGEHAGRYEPFARALMAHQIAVACPDLWGHGQSGGRRGDIARFDDYLNDLDAFMSQVLTTRMIPSAFTIFGHSFGGLAAIHWALRKPQAAQALILQSPLLDVGFPVPPWKARLIRGLAPWWPTFPVSMGLDPAWLSHDPAIVQRYRDDPLVHHRITLRCAVALQDAMHHAMDRASHVTLPTLLLYATADRVVSGSACQRFAERLHCEKRVMSFSDCYHELHHESVQPTIVEEIVRWVQAHGSPPRSTTPE